MDYEIQDEQLLLRRSDEEKAPLLNRLRRIEGQVRGLQQMIENDRHCQDELQQVNAVIAALRELALLLTSDHVRAGIDYAAERKDGELALADAMRVLRTALRS